MTDADLVDAMRTAREHPPGHDCAHCRDAWARYHIEGAREAVEAARDALARAEEERAMRVRDACRWREEARLAWIDAVWALAALAGATR